MLIFGRHEFVDVKCEVCRYIDMSYSTPGVGDSGAETAPDDVDVDVPTQGSYQAEER